MGASGSGILFPVASKPFPTSTMKNNRFIIVVVVAVLLVASMVWLRHSRPGVESETSGTNAVSEDVPTEEQKPESPSLNATHIESSNAPDFAKASAEQERKLAEMGITPGMTKEQMQERMAEWSRVHREMVAKNWRNPIEFYGKVVDQHEQPVAGVQVHFVWTDTSANGSSEADQLTDAKGQFALHNTTGRMLQVWLSKDGYYVPKSNPNNFDYATGYMADPNNPVVFRLWKKGAGADLITSQHGMSSTLEFSATTRDGSPVRVDFFNQKTSPDGQMEVSQKKPAYGAWQTATGWSYRLSIPDGGFVETTEEFPFEAPESGYQPVVEFKFQKGDANWTERLDKTFYIAFGIPRKYGRIHVETSMTTGTILEYAINPDGAQNLEPK